MDTGSVLKVLLNIQDHASFRSFPLNRLTRLAYVSVH